MLLINSVRLACVKHAASVRSEPGSNSHLILFTQNTLTVRYAPFLVFKERVSNIAELFYFCQGKLEIKFKKLTFDSMPLLRIISGFILNQILQRKVKHAVQGTACLARKEDYNLR